MKKNLISNVVAWGVLSSSVLMGCAGASVQGEKRDLAETGIQITPFLSDEAGFLVNSHLIEGEREAILVDAQFTRSQAKKLAENVRASGKRLKTIFITHGHPDHYFGLEVLHKEFPRAQILALPEVIKEIRATSTAKLKQWKPMYGADLTDKIVMPTAFRGSTLSVDGKEIRVLKLESQESEHSAALYVPELKALISGDLLYNQVHLWLAEGRAQNWLSALENLEKDLNIERVYPGHGESGDRSIIDQDKRYIADFLEAVKGNPTAEQAESMMKSKYGSYKLDVILKYSLPTYLK